MTSPPNVTRLQNRNNYHNLKNVDVFRHLISRSQNMEIYSIYSIWLKHAVLQVDFFTQIKHIFCIFFSNRHMHPIWEVGNAELDYQREILLLTYYGRTITQCAYYPFCFRICFLNMLDSWRQKVVLFRTQKVFQRISYNKQFQS